MNRVWPKLKPINKRAVPSGFHTVTARDWERMRKCSTSIYDLDNGYVCEVFGQNGCVSDTCCGRNSFSKTTMLSGCFVTPDITKYERRFRITRAEDWMRRNAERAQHAHRHQPLSRSTPLSWDWIHPNLATSEVNE